MIAAEILPASMAAILCGAAAGAGALFLILGLTGMAPKASRPKRFHARTETENRHTLFLWGGAAVVALLVLLITRWPVLAIALGALVVLGPKLFGGGKAEQSEIDRLDGLATWTESLRDTIAGAVGLEQAIPATATNASPAIRSALNLLVDRLRIREPLPSALLKFADDLDDPSADLIVAALVLNSRLRGPGLREVLTALALSAREELDVRLRVAAARRSTRRSVQLVVGITLAVAGLLILFNRAYLEAYNSLFGQMMLVIVIALYALGLVWLKRLAKVDQPDRFLVDTDKKVSTPVGQARAVGAGDGRDIVKKQGIRLRKVTTS